MSDPIENDQLASKFTESRRWITILFTDIVDSTRHWDELGDVDTRVLIEQHNSALIPLVEEYGGDMIKTIGDSIMATFLEPANAVQAAIAMQHCLHDVREKNPEFELKIRIGIHRGRALVEQGDVFGNAVNVASRIEGEAEGDEILISAAVAQGLDQERFHLIRRDSFTPRGKTNSILLYRVSWWRTESMLGQVPKPHRSRGRTRRAIELALYPAMVAGSLAYFALAYLPHLFAAWPACLNWVLNPSWAWGQQPLELALAGFAAASLLALPLSIRKLRLPWLRALRMVIAFSVGFVGFHHAAETRSLDLPGGWSHTFESAAVSLVEVSKGPVAVRGTPSPDAPAVATLEVGHRAPLNQLAETRHRGRWFRVQLGPGRFGWLPDEPAENESAAALRIVPGEFRTVVERDLHAAGVGIALSLWVAISGRRNDARRR